MPNKAIDQNGVLVIPNVRPEDGGTYECTGSDMFNMDTDRATLVVSGKYIKNKTFFFGFGGTFLVF